MPMPLRILGEPGPVHALVEPLEFQTHVDGGLDGGGAVRKYAHDAIAHDFIDFASILDDRVGHHGEVLVKEGLPFIRGQDFGKAGEIADVAKHDREVTDDGRRLGGIKPRVDFVYQ